MEVFLFLFALLSIHFAMDGLMFLALVGLKLFLAWVVALSLRFTVVVQL